MNPFNNRWLALFVIVGFLLVVAELIGTGEHGGVLSQTAQSRPNSGHDAQSGAAVETIHRPPTVVEDVPEDVPEEDQPQVITGDDVDDSGDFSNADEDPGPEMAEEEPAGDDPGEE